MDGEALAAAGVESLGAPLAEQSLLCAGHVGRARFRASVCSWARRPYGRTRQPGHDPRQLAVSVDRSEGLQRASTRRLAWEQSWERRLELGANSYGVRFLFPSTTSRIQGVLWRGSLLQVQGCQFR